MPFTSALPHDPITQVVDGIYLVRGRFQMGPGVVISRTMTIVKQSDGLVVLNAIRLTDSAQADLDRLGPVKHLIKLSESHGIDEPFYSDRYKPEIWAAHDTKFAGGITATKRLGPASPIAGGVVVEFPGVSGWKERALWVPNAGGTLITCDSLQHHVDTEHTSLLARIMTPMMGFKGGLVVAPMWRKMQKIRGAQVTQAMSQVAGLSFANIITGHGPAIIGGADVATRAAVTRASV
jgi:hypothetical protein